MFNLCTPFCIFVTNKNKLILEIEYLPNQSTVIMKAVSKVEASF